MTVHLAASAIDTWIAPASRAATKGPHDPVVSPLQFHGVLDRGIDSRFAHTSPAGEADKG